jgi:hypothetical protein
VQKITRPVVNQIESRAVALQNKVKQSEKTQS